MYWLWFDSGSERDNYIWETAAYTVLKSAAETNDVHNINQKQTTRKWMDNSSIDYVRFKLYGDNLHGRSAITDLNIVLFKVLSSPADTHAMQNKLTETYWQSEISGLFLMF